MYAEKISFENNSYRTPTYREEPALILNTGKGLNENKKGQNHKNLILSSGVVSPRIELGYQVPETCVLSIVLRDQTEF